MDIKYYQVDAFTNEVFQGNPAAVCILNKWLDDALMQNIAQENNLSETAFVVKNQDKYEIRWFTPEVEVDLCGHATLASAYVIFNYIEKENDNINFYSHRSGDLYITQKEDLISMDFPSDPIIEVENNFVLNQALDRAPQKTYKGKSDYLLVFNSQEDIENMTPDFSALQKIDARGVIVTAPGKSNDFVSRFFGPKVGIDEDPVTGSAHTSLTPYWSQRLNKLNLSAQQLSERGGELNCEYLGDRVKISGKAKLYMTGEISL